MENDDLKYKVTRFARDNKIFYFIKTFEFFKNLYLSIMYTHDVMIFLRLVVCTRSSFIVNFPESSLVLTQNL